MQRYFTTPAGETQSPTRFCTFFANHGEIPSSFRPNTHTASRRRVFSIRPFAPAICALIHVLHIFPASEKPLFTQGLL
jgi:hypothetical protein